MGKVYKNGIVSPKGFDMAASEPVDQREIVESINDLITLPQCYPGIEVKIVGEQYKEYKLIRLPSGDIDNWIEVVPEYNQPAQQTTDSVLNRSNLPGTTTTDALNSLAFGETGTYAEIRAIRDGNRLTPGNRYIITDYQTKYFINGSDSAALKTINRVDSIFINTWLIFSKGYDYLIEVGTVLIITSLPDGYAGSFQVGDTAVVNDIFDNYYFQVDEAWEQDTGLIGSTMSYALDRYENIPNDTIVNDGNGKPVIRPGGIVNTEVHDGTDYMDQTAAENYAVPTEIISLIAATTNSFEPQGFSGTFLGDQVYYDMDADEVINDNNEVIDSRPGSIYRRISKDLNFDIAVDWRVQRYRRWLLSYNDREKFTNQHTIENAGSPFNVNSLGNMVIGATYVIKTKYSGEASDNNTAWVNVGAPNGDIGTVFVATAVGGIDPNNGALGTAARIFAAADILAGEPYDVEINGDTDFTLIGSNNVIAADAIAVDDVCKIETVGDTDFTLIGSPDNVVGTIFTANGPGVGTGTVDNGNTIGSRFTATGPGVGTGYVTPPNLVRNSSSGWPLYGLYEGTIDDEFRYYFGNKPEEELQTLDRWGQMYRWKLELEDLARAKDFTTIPTLDDYTPDANSVKYIINRGEWSNVIINDLPGQVYNIDTAIDNVGIFKDTYIGAGMELGPGSSLRMYNTIGLDFVSAPSGTSNLLLSKLQAVSPTFFSGATSGGSLTNVIIGGTNRACLLSDSSSYTWFVFTNISSCVLADVALGCRIGNLGLSNTKMSNSAMFIGGAETNNSINPLITIERLTVDSCILETVVARFEGEMERSNFDRINTGEKNTANPRNQWVWTVPGAVKKTLFFLNQTNKSLLTKVYDENNVQTIEEVVKIDNR